MDLALDDAMSSCSEEEDLQGDAPEQVSTKMQARRTIFKNYLLTRAQSITKDELKLTYQSEDEERMSIRELLAREEETKITEPREYQLELFQRAKERNTIAVLDTGSGKTHISVLLLRHVLEQELEYRSKGQTPKLAFFLVDSVALAMQQHSVLSENLAHKVEPLCGAMNVDLWDKETWDRHFKENMACVCTAEVLYQCLWHNFIQMGQINLLIFDEAHHAKKDHPYARIMRDYYLSQEDATQRPKIFGMTASPVDIKVDNVQEAARQLENMLQAQIATTSNLALLQNFVNRPFEEVAHFYLHPSELETDLYKQLKERYGKVKVFQKLFDASKRAAKELGTWCSDIFWQAALTEAAQQKKERRTEMAYNKRRDSASIAEHDEQISMIREASDLVRQHHFGIPRVQEPLLSNKVIVLIRYLNQYFARPSDARCIVFVERRNTAQVLLELFTRLEGRPAHLKPGMLTGIGSRDDVSVSFREQALHLKKFRKGEINCLFATSVAEEGLDIPACNLVVRFDLYKTMIQYVQSRGRARHSNSRYLHMLEEGNGEQEYVMRDVVGAEQVMRAFCEALPEDRKLRGNDDDDLTDYPCSDFVEDEATRARLTAGASLAVLAHFVSSLPNENEECPSPLYNITPEKGQFICEVILPETSPMRSMVGDLRRRKATAKRSAALRMCKSLKCAGHLDENWLPTYAKKLPAFRNAQCAVSSKRKDAYRMKTKPALWDVGKEQPTHELYLTILNVTDGLDRPHRPVGLVTHSLLPDLPQFPLFLTSGKETNVTVCSPKQPIGVDAGMIKGLTIYTLRAWKDIWNKTFENDASKMSWWLAPLRAVATSEGQGLHSSTARELIDWDSIATVLQHEEYPWDKSMTEHWLRDRFIVDRWDGGRRFFVKQIMRELRPSDPVPDDAVKLDKYSDTIMNYTVRLWKKARETKEWPQDQPVLLAEQMLHRQNLLSPPTDKEKSLRTRAYICPSPMRISALASEHVAMLLVFPPIIYRIEQYLIALEAFNVLDLQMSSKLALEAMTKDSDNSGDHDQEQINFRPGMGANYERLEFLGDCFLKMATSIPLYAKNISVKEEIFHIERMLMLCNQNLFNTALELELFQYVRSQAFSRRTWYPEGLKLLEGRGHKKASDAVASHALADKTIADVCEAAIGAAFLYHNRQDSWRAEAWDAAVKSVTSLVDNEAHTMLRWSDYHAAYMMPEAHKGSCPAAWLDMAKQIEEAHRYHFKHPRLLRSAVTHGSVGILSEGVPTYERLEFLGDSLLDMACVSYLFYNYPSKDPQWLTEHKSAMVSNRFLGALCVKLGLHRFLRHNGSSAMEQDITRYVQDIRDIEASNEGRPDYWTEGKEAPKYLPDMVEAYIGAVFVDSGFDFGEVQRFFDEHMRPFFHDMTVYDSFAKRHPMTRLQDRLEVQLGCRDFKLMGDNIVPLPGNQAKYLAGVMIHDRVVVDEVGRSGRYAKMRVCAKAVKLLEGLAPFEFRKRFGCDCVPGGADGDGERDIGTAV